jgi:small conductance mechanosensitive channel
MNTFFDINAAVEYLTQNGSVVLIKLFGAIAAWVVGRWLIKLLKSMLTRVLIGNEKIDTTVSKYVTSFSSGVLTIGLAMAILGYLGVHTTSFAALLAGAGLAVGTAWGGLLTHFSAGVFLQILRPFKVGDYVNVGGIEGDVLELGLFGTTLLSVDNVTTIVGNNRVFSDVIKNYSTQPFRRTNCTVMIPYSVSPEAAIAKLRVAIAALPNVLETPAPEIEILEFMPEGINLCVRPFCHTSHHARLKFATYKAIATLFAAEGYPPPVVRIEQAEPLGRSV